ncbi:MAG: hypothetical protein JXM74_07070, partial [Fusobacteriaceae bacterium]|nr:hypothetical protein [Fusobacteriaceae bacterium]
MKIIIDYLEKMENVSGTLAKTALLRELLSKDENSETFFRMFFDEVIYGASVRSFEKALGVTKKDISGKFTDIGEVVLNYINSNLQVMSFDNFLQCVEDIERTSGNKQLEEIKQIFSIFESFSCKWLTRFIVKDLRIGISLKTFNKVMIELGKEEIKKFSVQLCGSIKEIETYDKGFPVGVGIKYDGLRGFIVKKGDEVTGTSRNGKPIDFVPEIME